MNAAEKLFMFALLVSPFIAAAAFAGAPVHRQSAPGGPGIPIDSVAISNVSVLPGSYSALITWTTDSESNGAVEFDTTVAPEVDIWPVDFYSNWSGTQGQNGVFYEYSDDGASWVPMSWSFLANMWYDPRDYTAHLKKIYTPTSHKIEFNSGHEGGSPSPMVSLRWKAQLWTEYRLLGSAECG
ncbi:MAG: hypothetical protein V1787_06390, partial [Candidatus Micrarchaeota archaeon]